MREFYGEISFPHQKGEFCRRKITQSYFISYFETPFYYEREGVMEKGKAGQMLIHTPGTSIYHGSYEEGFVNTWFYMECEELAPLLQKYPLPLNTAFFAGSDAPLCRFIERAKKEDSLRNAGYQDQLYFLAGRLIINLYRAYRRADLYNAAARLEEAREEIMQAPEKNWRLEEMAALCGYSVSRFSALYKEQFGRSPKQDILNARIDLACRMLRYTGSSITEISAACGFQNIYYFSKFFKKITGVSPKKYAESSK